MQKTKRTLVIFIATICCLMLLSQLAWGAWIIEQKQTMGKGIMVKSVMTFGDSAIRTDIPDRQSTTIMDFAKKKIYIIQHAQKMYMEMPLNMMKENVKKNLAEKRKNQAGDVIATKSTGEHKTIAGYDCEKIIMAKNGKKVGELWITSKLSKKSILKLYKKFFNLTGAQEPNSNDAVLEGLKKGLAKGFPMRSVFKDEQGNEASSEVTAIKQKKMAKSFFMPPKNYKKMAMPGMGAMTP